MGIIGNVFGSVFGGGGESSSTQINLTPEQRELIAKQVELADFQLGELQKQSDLQSSVFQSAEDAANVGPSAVEDELLNDQLKRIRAGGEATPKETELINQAVEQALASGETDIERFRSQNLESLREELAPQLGLRPGDTPILDRGGRVAAEATRQQGQLVSGLRGQQAQSLLSFPLQRGAVIGDLNQNLQEFQSRLRQSAFANRLQLAGAQTTAGLGLASVSAPDVGAAFTNLNSTTSADSSAGFGDIAGGIGSVLLGLGAVGIGSSREIKDIDGEVDAEEMLAKLAALPVGVWNYKGEDDKHIGAYAEDFRDAFGIGDGKTINIIDLLGVLTASVKALANREAGHVTA